MYQPGEGPWYSTVRVLSFWADMRSDRLRYIKRKRAQETSAAETKAKKVLKAQAAQSDREMVFGDVIKTERKPLSPKTTVRAERGALAGAGALFDEGGMGVKDEAMGLVVGGKGLKEVGKELIDDDD